MKAATSLLLLICQATLAPSQEVEPLHPFATKDEQIEWYRTQTERLLDIAKETGDHLAAMMEREAKQRGIIDRQRKLIDDLKAEIGGGPRSDVEGLRDENSRLMALLNERRVSVYKWEGSDQEFATEPFQLPLPRRGFRIKWKFKPTETYSSLRIAVYDQRDNSLSDVIRIEKMGQGSSWINYRGPSYYLKIDAGGRYEVEIETGNK